MSICDYISTALVCMANNVCPKASSTGTVLPVRSHALTKPQKTPLHCSSMSSWKVQRWCQLSALAQPHVDLFVQQRVKKNAHKHTQAWEISQPASQPFRWFPSLVPSYFCSTCCNFFWLSLSISVKMCCCIFSQRMAWESWYKSAQNSHMRKGLKHMTCLIPS